MFGTLLTLGATSATLYAGTKMCENLTKKIKEKEKMLYRGKNKGTMLGNLEEKSKEYNNLFEKMGLITPKTGAWIKLVEHIAEPCYRVGKFKISDNLNAQTFIKETENIRMKLNLDNLEIFYNVEDGHMYFRTLETEMKSIKFKIINNGNKIAIGVDIDNQIVYWDLESDPHGLVVGTTGSGKTSLIHMLLLNIITTFNCPPLFLIDLKKGIEFGYYKDIKGIYGYGDDIESAKHVIAEVERFSEARYDFLREKKYNNYYDYIKDHPGEIDNFPQFFVFIDEFADFMTVQKRKNEYPALDKIIELARKIRAVGGHLCVSTQRPTADNLPPGLKANCSFCCGFRVINSHNSRCVIDEDGLELLPPRHAIAILKGEKARFRTMFFSKKDILDVVHANIKPAAISKPELKNEHESGDEVLREDVLYY